MTKYINHTTSAQLKSCLKQINLNLLSVDFKESIKLRNSPQDSKRLNYTARITHDDTPKCSSIYL